MTITHIYFTVPVTPGAYSKDRFVCLSIGMELNMTADKTGGETAKVLEIKELSGPQKDFEVYLDNGDVLTYFNVYCVRRSLQVKQAHRLTFLFHHQNFMLAMNEFLNFNAYPINKIEVTENEAVFHNNEQVVRMPIIRTKFTVTGTLIFTAAPDIIKDSLHECMNAGFHGLLFKMDIFRGGTIELSYSAGNI